MSTFGLVANVAALLLGLATLVAALARPQIWRWVNLSAWLLTVGGFAALQFGGAGLSTVVATVAAAGIAVLRCHTEDEGRRTRILGFGAAIPVSLAIVGLVCLGDSSTAWREQMVLYTAAWAALAAGASSLLAGAACARRPLGPGVAVAACGAAVALMIAATGRSSLSQAFYGFPLRTSEGPLMWSAPPLPGFETGIQLSAAAPLPQIFWLVASVAAACAIAGALTPTRLRKLAVGVWAAGSVAAIGLLASLQPTIAGLSMPEDASYSEHVKRLLLSRNMADRAMSTGEWSSEQQVFVALSDLAPEVFAMTLVALIGLLAAFLTHKGSYQEEGDDGVDAAFGRDHAARGLGFAWIAWFVSAVVHDALYGSAGVGGPGEWALLGVLIASTGLMLVGWHRENPLFRVVAQLVAGLTVAALLGVAGFAWRFGSLPGFTIGVF